MTELLDAVIIGGGPAGMSAAWELRDRRIRLLEAGDRLGGRMHSEPRGDVWMNFGAHLFPGPGSRIQSMLADLGLRTIEIPGNKFAVWSDGRLVAPRSVAMMPFLLDFSLRERIALCIAGLRIMREVARFKRFQAQGATLPVTERRQKVASYRGNRSFEQFLGRLPARVRALFAASGRRASVEIDEQGAGVGISLFASVWAGKASSMALNLDGGTGALPRAVEAALGSAVSCGATVLRVAGADGGVAVTFERGGVVETVHARHAVVAVPATAAAAVCDVPEAVRSALLEVQYGPFVSLGVLTDEKDAPDWNDIYAITALDAPFDMVFNHTNAIRAARPGVRHGSYMMYAGGRQAKSLLGRSEEEITALYLAAFLRIFPALRDKVVETKLFKWSPGNACRAVGADFSPVVDHTGRAVQAIRFCGDYFAEIGNMEIAASTGLEAARLVRAELDANRKDDPCPSSE